MANIRAVVQLMEDDVELLGYARDLMELEEEEEMQRRPKCCQTRPWLLRRPMYGHYEALMYELELEDPQAFQEFTRMDVETFHDLQTRVEPLLTKTSTRLRQPICPGLKLALTLRYLATGEFYRSLRFNFRVAHNTMSGISGIVASVCQAILDVLEAEVIKTPTEPEEWKKLATMFQGRWQFPHALGAIDGKHVALKKPAKSGTTYFNYKGFCSIVLMALVDADYKFRWVQVGDFGSNSDGQIWNNSPLRASIDDGVIGIPDPEPLPGDDVDVPYYIVGDDAFAVRTYLMKPFGRRGLQHDELIFNYRLSRARRVVENAFGIMANRFRCMLTTMQLQPENIKLVVRTCVVLHNFLIDRNPARDAQVIDREDANHNLVPGSWRQDAQMHDMNEPQWGNRDTVAGKRQRLYLKHYLTSGAGAVHWQEERLHQY
ncbi:PREDICTED: uncharacterized protein LOC106804647 [Priapulus caudatus]|uniref:Uncharacterized protein LOC106804647 n=1 Tax=Priapulus caudatus TaxID=37621 RepID=A0ABM1DN79_PRICU|nr:PREDICTED: uncharacterized protein LOC106804647 [Priapulus caudatus]